MRLAVDCDSEAGVVPLRRDMEDPILCAIVVREEGSCFCAWLRGLCEM